ncbi:RebB family R body protein [Kordiimonas marina]|uniref:RebB family R body protein n=1 Tax=Kordiimonas marina TaxID=2872312 RepID=UPI001FF44904|nr:RebB family R body protein [Kordiimonas marina]MCJ9429353.1 RebB family R body protein [Kordiimonas marina]
MADNTPVNSQITDAVTQTNVKVVAEAPAQAMGLVYQTVAHSISLSMQNAMQAQGGLQQIGNAVTSSAVRMILEASGGGMGGGGSSTS